MILFLLFIYSLVKCCVFCQDTYIGYTRRREADLERGIELTDNSLPGQWNRAVAARNQDAEAPTLDGEIFDEDDLNNEEMHPHEIGNRLESIHAPVEGSSQHGA